jgi:hypothetical protein
VIAVPGSEQKLHQEYDEAERCAIGRDPRTMTAADLNATGHHKRPLLAVIRQNCIECAGGSQAEVRRCGMAQCPFWPYRMGTNPFAAPRSEAQLASASRLKPPRLPEKPAKPSSDLDGEGAGSGGAAR